MVYIVVGKKGRTVRYVSTKGNQSLRRLPMAFSSKREAEFARNKIRDRIKKRGIHGWILRIRKI